MPTACVVTSIFRPMAQLEGAVLGYSPARLVVVDHPLGGIDPQTVRERAAAVVDSVVRALSAHE